MVVISLSVSTHTASSKIHPYTSGYCYVEVSCGRAPLILRRMALLYTRASDTLTPDGAFSAHHTPYTYCFPSTAITLSSLIT
jgi:hypothetical protein